MRLINSCDITIYILQVIPGNKRVEGFEGFIVLHRYGFAWQGLGSGGAIGVASVRS